jgi:hypothetical protein
VVVKALFRCGAEGVDCLASLINEKKLVDFLLGDDSFILKRIICVFLSQGPSDLAVVKAFIEQGELDLEKFSSEESKEFTDALLGCGADGLNYLAELMNGNKLPNPSLGDSSISKKFAYDLLSQGPSGLGVVKALIEKSKLDLENYRPWKPKNLQMRCV